jgi:hypothetical protein
MKRYLLLALAMGAFLVRDLEARCVSISDPDELMTDVSRKYQIQTVKEVTFRDGKAGKGRAVVRHYIAAVEPERSQFDLILYRADGRKNRVMPLNDAPMAEAASIKAVSLGTNRDELYLEYPPLTSEKNYLWWMTILDTYSCEWVGIEYTQRGKEKIVENRMNWSDPRFEKHRAYIEKQFQKD